MTSFLMGEEIQDYIEGDNEISKVSNRKSYSWVKETIKETQGKICIDFQSVW